MPEELEHVPGLGIEQGEVLWVLPSQWPLLSRPTGYPIYVMAVRESALPTRLYIDAIILTDTGQFVDRTTFLLPADQPRAKAIGQARSPESYEPPPEPVRRQFATAVLASDLDLALTFPTNPYTRAASRLEHWTDRK
jgi:hypothetical protein